MEITFKYCYTNILISDLFGLLLMEGTLPDDENETCLMIQVVESAKLFVEKYCNYGGKLEDLVSIKVHFLFIFLTHPEKKLLVYSF